MVQNGLLSPYLENNGRGWVNYQQWYPGGLDMSDSLPALPMTAAILYNIVSFLGINVDLMAFVSFLPVIMGTLACLVLYLIGKDMGGKAIGLFAALFLALAPSFLARTALGFFDTEVPGILGLLLFIFLFLRAIEETRSLRSSLAYSTTCGAVLAYFILGWGASYFLLGLTALFVFVLIVLKKYSQRLLLSYSVTFGLALFIATKFPCTTLSYLTTGPVIAVAGMFILLCLSEILRHNISVRTKVLLTVATIAALVASFVVIWQFGYMQGIAGKFISVLDPFVRSMNPLISSVAEHRISAWGTIYYDLGLGIPFFIAGLYFTLRNPTNRNVFLLIFGATTLYFASSMVRLLVLFAPAFSLLAAMGILGILKPFYALLREAPQIAIKSKRRIARVSKEYSGVAIFLVFMILTVNFAFTPQTGGIPRVYGQAYSPIVISAASLPLAGANLAEPATEWLDMLSWTQTNLQSTDVVCSWWDYGYWLSIMGNVTTLADNATVNGTQIENIGAVYMSNETVSMKILERYNAKYILVFTVIGLMYSSDYGTYYVAPVGYGDEGKWGWMAKISGQARDRFIREGLLDENSAWTDETFFANMTSGEWYDVGKNTTIYKLMSWAKQQWATLQGYTPDEVGVQPEYFKEKYFAGLELTAVDAQAKYGGLIPIVALYEIDWEKYYNATGQP